MAEKIVLLLFRQPSLNHEEFVSRYMTEHVPRFVQHTTALRRYIVNIVDKPVPEKTLVQRDVTAFDIAAEMWFDTLDDFVDKGRMYDTPEGYSAVKTNAASLVATLAGYHVSETVQRDYERDWPDGERSPGVKMVMPLRRADGLTVEQFEHNWLQVHAPLALEHVPGIWRYVTNVVRGTVLPGSPDVDGIVEVHRRSEADLKLRMTPESQAIVTADTNALLQPPSRNQCSEYIIKS